MRLKLLPSFPWWGFKGWSSLPRVTREGGVKVEKKERERGGGRQGIGERTIFQENVKAVTVTIFLSVNVTFCKINTTSLLTSSVKLQWFLKKQPTAA